MIWVAGYAGAFANHKPNKGVAESLRFVLVPGKDKNFAVWLSPLIVIYVTVPFCYFLQKLLVGPYICTIFLERRANIKTIVEAHCERKGVCFTGAWLLLVIILCGKLVWRAGLLITAATRLSPLVSAHGRVILAHI
ncbi:hypothetical protein [Streptomyces eurythermus]|uniref:hypothetical protein n=1 Tax=Streptomyces eurythermus TaxID=42237 RepID=UPI0033D64FE6